MISCTRRRALHGAGVLLTTLAAGCSGSSSSSSHSTSPETAENVATTPDHYALRNPHDEPAAWIQRDGAQERDHEPGEDGRSWSRVNTRGLIASPATAARLSFADTPGTDEARTFVEETDFDRETLLIDSDRIGECFTRELCYLTWSTTEYHTYYARLYRDVDVACNTDDREGITHLIRIPDTLDPEQVTGSGSGMTAGTCYRWNRRLEARRRDANASTSTGQGGERTDDGSGGG